MSDKAATSAGQPSVIAHDRVEPATTGIPCKQCGGPVQAPRIHGRRKDFCKPSCRANWALDERRRHLELAQVKVAELGEAAVMAAGAVERLSAALHGVNLILDSLRQGRRGPRGRH